MKPDIEALRKQYPIGTRVELVRMDDIQAPPIGTKGTVRGVDDIGSIMVSWDNGSSLNVVFGEDEIRPLKTCPKCGKAYKGHPAISRVDNITAICPLCGIREALEGLGIGKEERKKIIDSIPIVDDEK